MSPSGRPASVLGARFDVRALNPGGTLQSYRASPEDCRAIAGWIGVEVVSDFTAEVIFSPWGRGGATVAGDLAANVTQLCVVTLEPVENSVATSFSENFSPAAETAGSVDIDDPNDAEAIVDGEIGIGDLLIDTLAMALDPYPRAPDAALPETGDEGDEAGEGDTTSPFAGLAALKIDEPDR